jgi:hypothetical protein
MSRSGLKGSGSKRTSVTYTAWTGGITDGETAEGYVRTHIIHQIERPKPEKPVIVPFTQHDIKRPRLR